MQYFKSEIREPDACSQPQFSSASCRNNESFVIESPSQLQVASSIGLTLLSCIAMGCTFMGATADTFVGMSLVIGSLAAMGLHICVWCNYQTGRLRQMKHAQTASPFVVQPQKDEACSIAGPGREDDSPDGAAPKLAPDALRLTNRLAA